MASRIVTSANKIELRDVVPGAKEASTITISSNSITPTRFSHIIAAESGTSDQLDTITLTNLRALDVGELTVDAGDTITVSSGVGNITTATGASISVTGGQTFRYKVNAAGDGVTASLVTGVAIIDEDDFASNSAVQPPSQQSTKAYIGSYAARRVMASGGTVAASDGVITVAAETLYTLTNADEIDGVTGLADGETAYLLAPASGSTTLVDGQTPSSGQVLNLSGADKIIQSTDESVYAIKRVGSAIRISGGGDSVWNVDASAGAGSERYGIVGDPALDDDFGSEFRVNRRYSRPKVDISSIVCADPGDTPELAFVIANGEPGAATVRDGAYPGAYIYSIPYDGENIFLSYPHSGRNAQISFPLTETDVTEYKRGGGICFATTREGTKTPIDRFWVAPDGGTWIGYRGTCEDNPAYDSVFRVTDGAITSGAATLTSATGGFTAEDASNSRVIRVEGAGASGADLVTTVSGYTDTNTVTLAANAGTTVTGATVYMGVDAYSYSSVEDASAPSGYHNWNDDKVSYGALNIICPDLDNGSGLTFLKSGEVGGNRGDTRFDIKMSHASGELKVYRVASGVEHQLMAFRNSIDQVDFTGTLLVEGADNENPQIFLRNTSESANEGHYWSLQNDNNGQLSIGSGSSSGGIETRMTLDKVATLTVESNDEGATGAQLNLYHNSPSPAVSDFPGIINFQGEDSAGNKVTYGSIASVTTNVTDGGTEAAELRFYNRVADDNTKVAFFNDNGGFVIGSPATQTRATGTMTAVEVWDDNTQLTDLVIDMAVDGSFDAEKYANHPIKESLNQAWFNPDWYAEYWQNERCLPGMVTWSTPDEMPSLGELVTRLTAVVETQAVLIENLNQRIKDLEAAE